MSRRGQGRQRTLYASLLQAALEEEPGEENLALATGIAVLLRRKAEMLGQAPGHPGSPPARASSTLAYDAALVRLCRKLDIDHLFFSGMPPDEARAGAEAALARRLPALPEDGLTGAEPVSDRPPPADGEAEFGA